MAPLTNHAITCIGFLVLLVRYSRAQTPSYQPVIAEEQPGFRQAPAENPAAGPVGVPFPAEEEINIAEHGHETHHGHGLHGQHHGEEHGHGEADEHGHGDEHGHEETEEYEYEEEHEGEECEGDEECFDEEELRSFEIAECFFDAGLAVFYLMRAALEINAQTLLHHDEPGFGEELASEISGTVSSFAEASSYLAGIAATCPTELVNEVETVCATAITELIGGTGNMLQGALGISTGCVNLTLGAELAQQGAGARRLLEEVNNATEADDTSATEGQEELPQRRLRGGRRQIAEDAAGHGEGEVEAAAEEAVIALPEARKLEENPRERPSEIAECVMSNGLATLRVGEAGLQIFASVKDCPHEIEHLACGAEIADTIASFALVSTYVSEAVATCGEESPLGAECADDVSRVIGGAAACAAGSTAIADTCVNAGNLGSPDFVPGEWHNHGEEHSHHHAEAGGGHVHFAHKAETPQQMEMAQPPVWAEQRRLEMDKRRLEWMNAPKTGDPLIEEERRLLLRSVQGGDMWTHMELQDLASRYSSRGLKFPTILSRSQNKQRLQRVMHDFNIVAEKWHKRMARAQQPSVNWT
eukprot:TRINITY_DN166_c0_g3_i1.p1 TRINITY_DN166_c0_g3~~TRINITY_DN166_c0_g3_i1.p1  ORF type:complete len:587 (-),score=128.08 TRINITY_DN166_c0_g3_i1:277-2037(-)